MFENYFGRDSNIIAYNALIPYEVTKALILRITDIIIRISENIKSPNLFLSKYCTYNHLRIHVGLEPTPHTPADYQLN